MSVPSTKRMLTLPDDEVETAVRLSMPLMVLRLSSSGRTISRSVSAGEDDG